MSMDLIFSKIKQLPVIPKLLHELMQDFSSDNSRIEDIAKKIAMDQVISAKVLKMANSAAYRRGPEITSIEQAVIRLGFNSLRSLVVASGLMTSFRTPSNFDKNKFWVDNFQVATIAKALAADCRAIEPETAFTCALLHNIGELLIQSTLPEEASLINMSISRGTSRIDAQREMLGYDYSQVGAELAKRWSLSDTFVRAIAQQLDPLNFEPISPEAVLIRLAMFVSFAWNAGVPPQVIVARFPTPLAQHLGIDPQRLAERLEELHQHGNELAAMLTT
ncbi:MAG: HDOD domain-containing protein [Aeromonadaceae bacterium]|nr:HDOD domain-containing protein [Aeromonadaceae bacterium]MBP8064867.1 HDOD domain-containing protein [Aeromonadaceae bacterium]MBP9568779.1 HDOD domain-containing protein [Aeromonadaceae bacterium]